MFGYTFYVNAGLVPWETTAASVHILPNPSFITGLSFLGRACITYASIEPFNKTGRSKSAARGCHAKFFCFPLALLVFPSRWAICNLFTKKYSYFCGFVNHMYFSFYQTVLNNVLFLDACCVTPYLSSIRTPQYFVKFQKVWILLFIAPSYCFEEMFNIELLCNVDEQRTRSICIK
jgi:hypothetical protein